MSDLPPGHNATFSTRSAGPHLKCTLRWTAAAADTSIYCVIFTARNDLRGTPDTTTVYTVDHATDLPPVVTCPDTLHLTVGMPRDISVSAHDPEGDPLFVFVPTDPLDSSTLRPVNLLTWTASIEGSHATGVLRLRVNRTGAFYVRFTAENERHGFATILVYGDAPDP